MIVCICFFVYTIFIYRHISHFMQHVPFPSIQRPRILVQVSQNVKWDAGGDELNSVYLLYGFRNKCFHTHSSQELNPSPTDPLLLLCVCVCVSSAAVSP